MWWWHTKSQNHSSKVVTAFSWDCLVPLGIFATVTSCFTCCLPNQRLWTMGSQSMWIFVVNPSSVCRLSKHLFWTQLSFYLQTQHSALFTHNEWRTYQHSVPQHFVQYSWCCISTYTTFLSETFDQSRVIVSAAVVMFCVALLGFPKHQNPPHIAPLYYYWNLMILTGQLYKIWGPLLQHPAWGFALSRLLCCMDLFNWSHYYFSPRLCLCKEKIPFSVITDKTFALASSNRYFQ